MPRLPDASALGARPSPRVSRGIATINRGSATAPGRAIEEFGAAVAGVGERQADKAADYELATARSNFLRQSLAIERELEQNPDGYAEWGETYEQKVSQLRQGLASSLRDNRTRQAFMEQSEDALIRGQDRMLGLARRREVDAGRASLDSLVAADMEAALSVSDRETRDAMLGNIGDAIEGARARGYLTDQEAVALRRSTVEGFAARRLAMLPPAERLTALGGSIPGSLPQEIGAVIETAAAAVGEDAETLRRIAVLESAGDPGAINPTSGAAGLFQFMGPTAAQYGLENPMDAVASANAAARLLADNRRMLRASLGRDPQPWELYFAHQQGAGGATALLVADRMSAVDALAMAYGGDKGRARAAIVQNGGSPRMSAGQFAGMWRVKFERSAAPKAPPAETGLLAYLPPDEAQQMRDRALREVEAEQARAERAYVAGLEDYVDAVASGAEVSPPLAERYSDQALNVMIADPAERARFRAVRDDALTQAGLARRILGATPDEIDAIAGEIESWTDGEVLTETGLALAPSRTKAQEAFRRALREDVEARAADPAAYALAAAPGVREAAEAIGEDGAGSADYASAALAEQARLGVPGHARRVLTEDRAKGTVAALMRAPADERGAQINRLEATWGEHWPRVLNQLRENDLPAPLYHAALVMDDPVLSERVASLADVDAKALAEGIPSVEVTDLRAAVADEMVEFRAAFEAGDPTGRAAEAFNDLLMVAEGVALQEYRRTGDSGDAVSFAVERLVTDRYAVLDGGQVLAYVPRGVDAGAVEDGAMRALEPEMLERIAPLGGDEGSPEFLRNNRIRMAAENGVWITNSTADGLDLMVEIDGRLQRLYNDAGRPYGFTFDELARMGDGSVDKAPAGPAFTIRESLR